MDVLETYLTSIEDSVKQENCVPYLPLLPRNF